MTNRKSRRTAALLTAATTSVIFGAPALDLGVSTPLRPTPGYFNEVLRTDNPSAAAWNVGANYRVRYEQKENGGFTGAGSGADFSAKAGVDNDNSYLLQKVLPRVGYTGQWIEVFVQGRHSSSAGDERPSTGVVSPTNSGSGPDSDGPMDIQQAYVTLGNHKEFPVSLKVGRQELNYGDERLVGAFVWNNLGRVFDAAKVRWQTPWFAAEAFTSKLVLPDDNNFNLWNDYDYFHGLYITSTKIPKNWSEFYFLSRNASADAARPGANSPFTVGSARDIYTVGFRFRSATNEWGNWDYTVESAGQFGHFNDPAIPDPTVRSLEHQAYAAYAGAGYTWRESVLTPRLGAEVNYASGDSNPVDGKHETFENLFPTNHKFYGFADFASLQNLVNLRLMSSIKPRARLTLLAEGHLFWLADTHDSFYNVGGARRGGIKPTNGQGYGINPEAGSFVGSEVDIVESWAVSPFLNIEGAYAHFFRGDYVKDSLAAVGSVDANYVYVQAVFNF